VNEEEKDPEVAGSGSGRSFPGQSEGKRNLAAKNQQHRQRAQIIGETPRSLSDGAYYSMGVSNRL
jgi:hypothetical protein